ncbi:hypothetical protein ACQRIT_005097 [Beauveria bassiana]|uniref:Uncharacterized protein n=3 Tax=Beauveria bassiana TaxID=176275 RepID=J4UHU9_BEAB2|nr:uncharacterized protein BBA_08097 [Beauveria bassiana ARSEF 2860]EJP62892.1 hypothetical protein BBA_08097 [Beauveria bassiana ARSEF 2860]KAH8720932.1 hypothetical protein HC256_001314 [Beauveria bassiana]KGQ03970.1 hypothetical protein BBAD15_g10791 [Beauveria bassiana D1-5]PQK17716.1 hypothetical protein BB8028_0008g02230 [Beauveria bassiana]
MGGALERALPLALAVFCGVAGGFYTFQPMLTPKEPQKTVHVTAQTTDSNGADAKADETKARAAKPS